MTTTTKMCEHFTGSFYHIQVLLKTFINSLLHFFSSCLLYLQAFGEAHEESAQEGQTEVKVYSCFSSDLT